MAGYTFNSDEFAQLLIAKSYPEKTDQESALLRDYLREHLHDFDRVEFSVRIGAAVTPDPSHLDGVQRQAILNSMKRIDMVGYFGQSATLVEAKTVLSHQVLGQLLSDRLLWIAEHPDADEPALIAIGRRSTPQDLAILQSHGITAILYDAPAAAPASS